MFKLVDAAAKVFFRVGRSVDLFLSVFFSKWFNRSLILFATISAILLAMVAMTSSSFRACFTHCIISSSAVDIVFYYYCRILLSR